jgi:uncharacterized protein YbjT (DUF2867 family)
MKIVVTGASGFVGGHLVKELARNHEVVGISRRPRESKDGVTWAQCDLFSRLDLEKTLLGADVAVYLIHSMLPSARLTQGSFRDFDMILADNFARAARACGVKRIVYLSGIIPPDAILSEHLQSRLEVENILKESGVAVSCLRAGLIIGPGGSSFEMMIRLVRRLPAMVCPSWTSTLSYPVSIWDVVEALKNRIETAAEGKTETIDLCGPDAYSYEEMMRLLSRVLGRRHFFIRVPFVSPSLSKLWVSLITGAPKDLVYPLVDSLKTHMIPLNPVALELPNFSPLTFEAAIRRSLDEGGRISKPNAFVYTGQTDPSYVISVQRMTTLFRSDVKKIAAVYFDWLGSFLCPFIKVEPSPNFTGVFHFKFYGIRKPLLVLERSIERSSKDRELFYIRSGLLVAESPRARIEFRDIYQGLYKIIAIHEYKPRLPWLIYKYTQAIFHLIVMKAFARHLIAKKL